MMRIIAIILALLLFACNKSNNVIVENTSSPKEKIIQDKYSELLEVNPVEIQNYTLYSFIDEWIGTKYQYGGMSKSGVDCSGFCNILYNEIYNKQLPRTTSEISNQVKAVSKEKLQEGDIVVFNIANRKNSHVGIYLKNNKFIHASTSSGVVISSLENPYYVKSYSKGGSL